MKNALNTSEKSNHKELKRKILELSNSNDWDSALLEWKVYEIYKLDDGNDDETCLCGHYPIRNICILKNVDNNNTTLVGNICVNQFISEEPNKVFTSFERISSDLKSGPCPELIKLAHNKGVINDWEHDFAISRYNKKRHSEKQLNRRIIINRKILQCLKKAIS